MFSILFLHLVPVLVFTAVSWRRKGPGLSYLLAIPCLLLLLTTVAILVPTTGKYIETALEIVIRKVTRHLLFNLDKHLGEAFENKIKSYVSLISKIIKCPF